MGNVGVDILKISTLPFSPTDHHANDMRVVVLSQKDNRVATYSNLIRSHSSIAASDIPQLFHTGCERRGQARRSPYAWLQDRCVQ